MLHTPQPPIHFYRKNERLKIILQTSNPRYMAEILISIRRKTLSNQSINHSSKVFGSRGSATEILKMICVQKCKLNKFMSVVYAN